MDENVSDTTVRETSAQDGPRVIVREGYMKRRARIELDGDYRGVWAEVWINCPKRLLNRIAMADADRSDAATAGFVLDHNLQYPVDQDRPDETDDEDAGGDDWQPTFRAGQAMPKPLDAEAVGYLPIDLYRRIVELGSQAVQDASKVTKRG